jgi:murein L,D-transpeptidase YafK
MTMFKKIVMLALLLLVAACAQPTKFRSYNGPEVTSLVVFKARRQMLVMHDNDVLQTMSFQLGFNPVGPKQFERDGRTPEGTYRINRRNPNSQYHLSLGISYPNVDQVAAAAAVGRDAGGEIFIHGTPPRNEGDPDWTVGCIAVTNDEIEQLYAMVRDGTPIFILP